MDVALRIPDEFHSYVHEENVLGRDKWTIDLGSSNASFFQQLFGYMFENVIILGPDDNALDYTFDALVEPKIEGFEFSIPNQSKTDAFAVWIRYRMQVFDSLGNSASSWTVSAYGKSQKEGMGGSKSLQRAAADGLQAVLDELRMEQGAIASISNRVFTRNGKPIKSIRTAFELALEKNGIQDLRFHDFRHTCITNWATMGIPREVVMAASGHSSIEMHDGYVNVKENHIRNAFKMLTRCSQGKSVDEGKAVSY